jgi:hypothetical protein
VLFSVDARASLISFDDLCAPSLFIQGNPLSEQYAALGVHFQGSGVVLNSYSNFEGVPLSDTHGTANFLAFNGNVGVAPPEAVLFDNPVNFFSWDFAGTTGNAQLNAYLGDALVGSTSITAFFGVWNEMSLSATAFDKVIFSVSNTDPHFVVDNLRYGMQTTPVAVPLPASLWLLASAGLGLLGAAWRKQT